MLALLLLERVCREWACIPKRAGALAVGLNDRSQVDEVTQVRCESASLTAGQLIGGCRIVRLLGRGGMGEVYLAEHLSLQKLVAVKVLPPTAESRVHVDRFLREARTCAQVEHPNVVFIHDVGADGNLYYIVMQYVQGKNLAELLVENGGRIPWRSALRLVQLAALGLDAVHCRGLVHRDVKPSNIMLSNQSRVLLMDFGLVREENDSGLTQSGQVVGTPAFMSPEQSRGRPLDRRSDVYSLGGTLYCLLTGKPPFRGSSQEVLLQIASATPPKPVHELRPEVPIAVSELVSKAMAARPEDRFPSAAAMAEAIRQALRAVLLPKTTTWQASGAPCNQSGVNRLAELPPVELLPLESTWDEVQKRLPWIGAALAGVLFLVLLGIALRSLTRPPVVPPAAVEATAQPVPAVTTAHSPPSKPVDASLFRDMVAIEAGYAQLGNSRLKLQTHFATIAELAQNNLLMEQALACAGQETVERVHVPAFWIDKYEVTNEQYARFLQENHRDAPVTWGGAAPTPGSEQHPVHSIYHRDAEAYAAWAGKKLPTRAQWMRAFRGERDWLFPWGDDFDAPRANVAENKSFLTTSPVNATPRDVSPFGVYNLEGNVCEFLRDKTLLGMEQAVVVKGAHFNAQGRVYGVGCMQFTVSAGLTSPGFGFRCVTEEAPPGAGR